MAPAGLRIRRPSQGGPRMRRPASSRPSPKPMQARRDAAARQPTPSMAPAALGRRGRSQGATSRPTGRPPAGRRRRRMRRPSTQETLGVSCGRSSGERPWRALSTDSQTPLRAISSTVAGGVAPAAGAGLGEQAQAWMPERSGHAVSGRPEDARERPATRQGPPRPTGRQGQEGRASDHPDHPFSPGLRDRGLQIYGPKAE